MCGQLETLFVLFTGKTHLTMAKQLVELLSPKQSTFALELRSKSCQPHFAISRVIHGGGMAVVSGGVAELLERSPQR